MILKALSAKLLAPMRAPPKTKIKSRYISTPHSLTTYLPNGCLKNGKNYADGIFKYDLFNENHDNFVRNSVNEVYNIWCHISLSSIMLTHWGQVAHIRVSKLTTIGSDNGLSPGRRQGIIRTNTRILLISPLGTKVSEILIEIHIFPFKKMHLKMSSGKWRLFCSGLNVLDIRLAELMINQNDVWLVNDSNFLIRQIMKKGRVPLLYKSMCDIMCDITRWCITMMW